MRASELRSILPRQGFSDQLIRDKIDPNDQELTGFIQFARPPFDARSACIVVLELSHSDSAIISRLKGYGAPIIFVCLPDAIEWWKQDTNGTTLWERVEDKDFDSFLERYRDRLTPDAIFRAKTRGRFENNYQMEFVDTGLMPLIESEVGNKVSNLIERCFESALSEASLRKDSDLKKKSSLLKYIFWLVAAKILKDKSISGFKTLDIENVVQVAEKVSRHFGVQAHHNCLQGRFLKAVEQSSNEISQFASLELITTESLAYIYENTQVSEETRNLLGTHSTPTYLVDYVVGNMADWISKLPEDERFVFEPACGHAPFLTASLKLLADLTSGNGWTASERHKYLKAHIHGFEKDPFALEIARLSLTLADLPNSNGWHLDQVDMFEGDLLAHRAKRSRVVFSNPPFELFNTSDFNRLRQTDSNLHHQGKAIETFARCVRNLPNGGIFGFVLPQVFLHEKSSSELRKYLVENFELREISQFSDRVFEFADHETCLLLGRKTPQKENKVRYRSIREKDSVNFAKDYVSTWEKTYPQSRFLVKDKETSLRVPELENIWQYLDGLDALCERADIGRGFSYFGENTPERTKYKDEPNHSETEIPGFKEGFLRLNKKAFSHELPTKAWLNLRREIISVERSGLIEGREQILLNYAPINRGPWRLKAQIDSVGLPIRDRFIVIRPTCDQTSIIYWWAILNSPLANAYFYCHSGKRDNLTRFFASLPIPQINPDVVDTITQAATSYLDECGIRSRATKNNDTPNKLRELHDRLDAAILNAYRFPAELETEVLKLFSHAERRSVPFEFNGYLPDHYNGVITLRDINAVTYDWDKNNDRRADLILKKKNSSLNNSESEELANLQQLASKRRNLIAPLETSTLDKIENELRAKGLLSDA